MRVMSAIRADTSINALKGIKDPPLVNIWIRSMEVNTLALKHFSILRKCQSKLDCLIYEIFFINELKTVLKGQINENLDIFFFI